MADETSEAVNLEHIEMESLELSNQQAIPNVARQDTLTTGIQVISTQKRFSLPLRPAPSLVEHFSFDKGEHLLLKFSKNYLRCQ